MSHRYKCSWNRYWNKRHTVTLLMASLSLHEPCQLPDRYHACSALNRDKKEARCLTHQLFSLSAPEKKILIQSVFDYNLKVWLSNVMAGLPAKKLWIISQGLTILWGIWKMELYLKRGNILVSQHICQESQTRQGEVLMKFAGNVSIRPWNKWLNMFIYRHTLE